MLKLFPTQAKAHGGGEVLTEIPEKVRPDTKPDQNYAL